MRPVFLWWLVGCAHAGPLEVSLALPAEPVQLDGEGVHVFGAYASVPGVRAGADWVCGAPGMTCDALDERVRVAWQATGPLGWPLSRNDLGSGVADGERLHVVVDVVATTPMPWWRDSNTLVVPHAGGVWWRRFLVPTAGERASWAEQAPWERGRVACRFDGQVLEVELSGAVGGGSYRCVGEPGEGLVVVVVPYRSGWVSL